MSFERRRPRPGVGRDANGSLQHSTLVAPHKARVLALRGDITQARMAMTGMLAHAQRIGSTLRPLSRHWRSPP